MSQDFDQPQKLGHFVPATSNEGEVMAFVPSPLPEQIQLSALTMNLLDKASLALGRLDGAISSLPNPGLLRNTYMGREALDSSRIEGTDTSLSNVLSDQAQSTESNTDHAVAEVRSYIKALSKGLKQLEDLPISLRFLRNVHRVLMQNPRGQGKAPGEFRRVQNQIASVGPKGDLKTVFVPPPVPQMEKALDDLERYINADIELPDLIVIGLVHYQFETIHPFMDGNGRTGRLLIIFQMLTRGLLQYPLLSLSTSVKKYQSDYYLLLSSVREQDRYDLWLNYFLSAVQAQAEATLQQARDLIALHEDYRTRLSGDRSRAVELIDLVLANPVLTTSRVVNELGVVARTATNLLNRLRDQKVLSTLQRKSPTGEVFWVAPEVFEILVPDEILNLVDQVD